MWMIYQQQIGTYDVKKIMRRLICGSVVSKWGLVGQAVGLGAHDLLVVRGYVHQLRTIAISDENITYNVGPVGSPVQSCLVNPLNIYE